MDLFNQILIFFRFFEIIYIPALLTLIIIFLLTFIICVKTDIKKITQVFLVTISTLFLFSIIDNTKSYKKIPFFERENYNNFDQTTLVLIWDEMSGLNSLSSKTEEGQLVDKNFEKLFQKYKFDYYSNAFSISDNSVSSLTSLVNFENELDNINEDYVSKSKNYYSEYEMKKNLLFQKFKSVSVIQNIHINYCNNSKVSKCYQYNPLNLEILNTDIDPFSNIVSSWSLNGSIIGKFTWRSLKQFNLIKSTLDQRRKMFIKHLLNYVQTDLNSKKFDLVFVHLLVPHKPYGFNSKCEYDVSLSNLNIYLNTEENIRRHNRERKCVINLMDDFFNELEIINDYRIFIMSDHGSRITKQDISSFSTIFAYKDYMKQNSKIIWKIHQFRLYLKKSIMNDLTLIIPAKNESGLYQQFLIHLKI